MLRPSAGAVLGRVVWPLLVFEATIQFATLVLLDPLLAVLLERIVLLSGDPFVGNTELVSFVLSPAGMLALATGAIGLILVNALALGGVSLILWEAYHRSPVRQIRIWRALLYRLPALLTISAGAFAAALLLLLPVLAAAFAARHWFLSTGDLYFYVSRHPPEFLWALGVIGAAAAVSAGAGLFLLLRAGLSVPICLLRPVGAGRALRLAVRATSGRTRVLMPKLLAVMLGLAMIWVFTGAALSLVLGWLLAKPATPLEWVGIGFAAGTAFALALLTAVSRTGLVLVLMADRTAADVLPPRGNPGPAFTRFTRLRLAAMLLICAAIPAAALAEAGHAASSARPIAITAHRAGSVRAPENTLAALRNAIAERADVVEIDVQETADGHVVVLHDTDLRRVAGVARSIWDMRLDELQTLDAGSWFSPEFASERIPTLHAFAAASRGKVMLNVELKNNRRGQDLAARVVAILRATGTADNASVSSLDIGLLRQVRQIAPNIKLGLILAAGVGNLRSIDVDFFALSRRLATPAVIRRLHAAGKDVQVWTLDDEESMGRAMLDGADNIITGDTLLGVKARDWFDDLSELERMLLRIGVSVRTGWLRAITGPKQGGIPKLFDISSVPLD